MSSCWIIQVPPWCTYTKALWLMQSLDWAQIHNGTDYASTFSPLAAHWFANTIQTGVSVRQAWTSMHCRSMAPTERRLLGYFPSAHHGNPQYCVCRVWLLHCLLIKGLWLVGVADTTGGSCRKYLFLSRQTRVWQKMCSIATKDVFCHDKHVYVVTKVSLS